MNGEKKKKNFTVKNCRTESIKVNNLQMSNNSWMNESRHANASHLCGKDPVYYTSIIGTVVDWVIFLIGLPEVCLAFYALLYLLKKDKAALIFAINLLLSDLMQIVITVVFIISRFFDANFYPFVRARCFARLFVRLGLTSSLGFMVLISAERYFMVACPVRYHAKSNTKLFILISVCMWSLSLTYSVLDYVFMIHTRFSLLLFSSICLLPAPLLLGFFTATWKALNKSVAMRHEIQNRRRVLGVLSLVLGTYTVFFLPFSFRNLYFTLKGGSTSDEEDLSGVLTSALVFFNPLIDSLIYIFVRKDIRDAVEAFPCCKIPLMMLKQWQDRVTDTSQIETAL